MHMRIPYPMKETGEREGWLMPVVPLYLAASTMHYEEQQLICCVVCCGHTLGGHCNNIQAWSSHLHQYIHGHGQHHHQPLNVCGMHVSRGGHVHIPKSRVGKN